MEPRPGATGESLSISAVERETGLSKDTLRVWEKRYGFPTPGRDANGERLYSAEQVTKLRLIKGLVDRGARPSKVVGLPMQALQERSETRSATADPPELVELVELVRARNLTALRDRLERRRQALGIARFLSDTIAPLNIMVGNAWMRGEVAIFEEHLYTEVVQMLLRAMAAAITGPGEPPRVILTTLPGEQHLLGLLMAQCMLKLAGATCFPLGPQTPAAEIVRAVDSQDAQVVGLSFSAAYPAHTATDTLTALRAMLPAPTELWIGGSNPALFRRRLGGVVSVREIAAVPDVVADWRARQGGA